VKQIKGLKSKKEGGGVGAGANDGGSGKGGYCAGEARAAGRSRILCGESKGNAYGWGGCSKTRGGGLTPGKLSRIGRMTVVGGDRAAVIERQGKGDSSRKSRSSV